MKRGRSGLILLLAVLLLIAGVVYYLYDAGIINFGKAKQQVIEYGKNSLYFVTNGSEGYGISTSDGNQVLECKYKRILRTGNSVYLNDGTESYVFFLDSKKSISLGGKETDVDLVYNKETGDVLPYFILKYGGRDSAVYRIYTDEGIRYNNKDFTSMDEVKIFLDAQTTYKAEKASKELTDKYNVKSTLSYPTQQNRSQYIVSLKEDKNSKFGIVDETGRIVLDLACDSITEITGKKKGVLVNRNEKVYLFYTDEKLQEVDSGFEFVTGMNFVYQKKGTTVNKVYSTNGEVLIDGIYNYNRDFTEFYTNTKVSYLFLNVNGKYELYNANTNQKYGKAYSNLSNKYLSDYEASSNIVWETGFIFVENGIPYCVDFSDMKESRMNVVIEIQAPLDIGFKFDKK